MGEIKLQKNWIKKSKLLCATVYKEQGVSCPSLIPCGVADFCVLYKKYNYQILASFCLSILLAKALYTMRLVKLKLHGPFISPASFRVLCCPSQRRPPHTTHASQNLELLTEVELVHDIPEYLVQGGKKDHTKDKWHIPKSETPQKSDPILIFINKRMMIKIHTVMNSHYSTLFKAFFTSFKKHN